MKRSSATLLLLFLHPYHRMHLWLYLYPELMTHRFLQSSLLTQFQCLINTDDFQSSLVNPHLCLKHRHSLFVIRAAPMTVMPDRWTLISHWGSTPGHSVTLLPWVYKPYELRWSLYIIWTLVPSSGRCWASSEPPLSCHTNSSTELIHGVILNLLHPNSKHFISAHRVWAQCSQTQEPPASHTCNITALQTPSTNSWRDIKQQQPVCENISFFTSSESRTHLAVSAIAR